MTPSEMIGLALALTVGVALGAFFFGGLWWTVRKGMACKHPAPLFLGSLLLRTFAVAFGFYAVSVGHWERLAVCLLGFVVARVVVTRWIRRTDARGCGKDVEAVHAP